MFEEKTYKKEKQTIETVKNLITSLLKARIYQIATALSVFP